MIFENVLITDAGSEGMAIGKINEQVIFIPFGIPGDIVNVQIIKKKRRYLEGKILSIIQPSPKRVTPHCSHFGICGGCRWQNMTYKDQLFFKEKQVLDNLTRIGKIAEPAILPIIPSSETRYYRNKLDFTFSIYRWRTEEELMNDNNKSPLAAGFHVPQFFDKVVDIEHCYHQADPSNAIRNAVRNFAIENQIPFYDVRRWEGQLRNLIIRNTLAGDLMVIVVFRSDDHSNDRMMNFLKETFPEITSLYMVINPKKNDTIYDLEFQLFNGKPFITEIIPPYQPDGKPTHFRIGPVSFFQTNSRQAETLNRVTAGFAGLKEGMHVYDLYTGTGAIACYIAPYVGKVTGIESVEAAVQDARINASANGIDNTVFYAGETEKLLTPGFIATEGAPDVVVTDPPRNGMHEKVIRTLIEMRPPRIVYVSCNPATQARDLLMLSGEYTMVKCQPIDMFPHTQHVENIALLESR